MGLMLYINRGVKCYIIFYFLFAFKAMVIRMSSPRVSSGWISLRNLSLVLVFMRMVVYFVACFLFSVIN